MNSKKNIFWGLVLIGAAGLIIFRDQLPSLGLPLWKLFLVVYAIIESVTYLFRKDIHLAYAGAAVAFITLNSEYRWLVIGTWHLILAAVLIYIGLHLIFPRWGKWQGYVRKTGRVEDLIGKGMGSGTRYINDDNFVHGDADIVFSTSSIYFDNAVILGDKASFDLDVVFGSATLYLPRNWAVDVQSDNVFSRVDCQPPKAETDKILYIRGGLVFSNLTVLYI